MSQSTPTDSLNQSCDECDFRKQLDTYKKINRKVFFRIGTTVIVYLFFINFSAYPNQYKTVTERIIMIVKRAWNVFINKDHELYEWCADMTGKANNLSNAVRFRQRQVFFARNKDVIDISDNEKEPMRSMLFWRHADM